MLIGWLGRPMGPLLDGDGGGGSGSGDNSDKVKTADILERYSGNAVTMAQKLADMQNERFEDRQKLRDRDARIKELEAKQTPDGAVVLTGDDASRWQAYTALGLKPEEVKTRLEEGDAARDKAAKLERNETLRTVATAAGFKPEGLQDFDQLAGGLTYTVKDVQETQNGKTVTVKRAFVQADGKDTPLDEYVTQTRPHLLPALKTEATAPQPAPHGTPPRDRPRGTPPADQQKNQDEAARQAQAPIYRQF